MLQQFLAVEFDPDQCQSFQFCGCTARNKRDPRLPCVAAIDPLERQDFSALLLCSRSGGVSFRNRKMRAIITHQPSCEVAQIDRPSDETMFHLATGEILRVGLPSRVLEARLKIDLSHPPRSLRVD